ncbi:lipopolysaccharide biosynthesis protein [Limnobacter parvus]|uniref:Lipopolysaccharide biosynthesis protein n=1 Tax=Limnobacter parvus TaxID=2939690 RepID=A0ABT1XD67_9BURK|nr:lipopolysaccharide biosynthesis protein [Limnobacter parvus]MCR2745220.1 lipopolysaccharide biosynthesis protein [Limnobacter parvus]
MLKLARQYYQANKDRVHRLSKEGSWVVGGQIASVMGSLALVLVLTEYLSLEQYGQLALGLTVAGLVNQVVMGGLAAGIGRYYSIAAERKDLSGYLRATRYLLICATALVLAIGLMLMTCLYWLGYGQWIHMAAVALLFAVLSGYNSVLNGIQNAARQRAIVALHGGLDAWLKIFLALCLMLWLDFSSTVVLIGYACSSMLIIISQIIFLRRTIPLRQTSTQLREKWAPQIYSYSFPFTIFGIFTWGQQISDRWALQVFASTSDVGQYAVLFQLGFTPIALITGMAVSFLGPVLYQRSGDATDQTRNTNVHRISWRIAIFSLFFTLLGSAITLVLHEWLFGILVASEFHGNSHLLPLVILSGGVFAAGQMLALKLLSEMKPSAMTVAKIITALTGILLNITGAALGGLQGVVWAMLAFSGFYFVWMAILARRMSTT